MSCSSARSLRGPASSPRAQGGRVGTGADAVPHLPQLQESSLGKGRSGLVLVIQPLAHVDREPALSRGNPWRRRAVVGDPPVRVIEAAESKEYRRSGAAGRIGRRAALLSRRLDALLNHGSVVARGSLRAYGGDLQQRSSGCSTFITAGRGPGDHCQVLPCLLSNRPGARSSAGRARGQRTADVHDTESPDMRALQRRVAREARCDRAMASAAWELRTDESVSGTDQTRRPRA